MSDTLPATCGRFEAGPDVQLLECDVSDGTCQELEALLDFGHPHMTHREALKYKYVLDM